MSHLRAVPDSPGHRGTTDRTRPLPADDLIYVPARLMLALAGRCSCDECGRAHAEHRPQPHQPQPDISPEPRRRHLRAM